MLRPLLALELALALALVHASFIYGFHTSTNFSTQYSHITGSSYKNNENSARSNSNKNITAIRGITYGIATTKLGNIIYNSTGGDTSPTRSTANSFMTRRDEPGRALSTLATISKKWQIYNSTLSKQISNQLFAKINKLRTTPTVMVKMNFSDSSTADNIKITSNRNYSEEYNHSSTTRKPKRSRRTYRYRNSITNVTKSSFHVVHSRQQNETSNDTTPTDKNSFNTTAQNIGTADSTTDSLSYSSENGNVNATVLNSHESFIINSTGARETFPNNVTKSYYEPINMTTLNTNAESETYKQITSTQYNYPSKETTNYISVNSVPINESKFRVSEGLKDAKEDFIDSQTITNAYIFTDHMKENDNNETTYIQPNLTLQSIQNPSKPLFISSQALTRKVFSTTETSRNLQSSLINIKKNWTSTTDYLGPGMQNQSDVSFLSTISEESTPIRYFNSSAVKSTTVSDSESTVSEEITPITYFDLSTLKSTAVGDSESTISEEYSPVRDLKLGTDKSTFESDTKSSKYILSSVPENGNTNVRPSTESIVIEIETVNSTTMTTQITASNYNVTRLVKKCDIKCHKNEICVFTKRNKKQCVCKPNFERDKNSKICKEVGISVITTHSYYITNGTTNLVKDLFPKQEEQNCWVYSFKKWNNLTKYEKINNAVTIMFNEEVEALEWFRNFDLQFRQLIASMLRKRNYTCKNHANNYNFDARNVVYISPSPVIKNGTSTVSFIVESIDMNCTQKYVSGQSIRDMLFKLDNGTMKLFQLHIISVDVGKAPEAIICEHNIENVLKLVITSVTITAAIASFLVLAILLIKCRQCNKFNQPRVQRYKTWDSKCAFATGNDLASDIQCVGDEADIVMECNGVKTGKVREISKPQEKLSVLVHNEEKLELECSTSVKMKFKDKDDTKL